MMTKAARLSKITVTIYETTWHHTHIPEDHNLYTNAIYYMKLYYDR